MTIGDAASAGFGQQLAEALHNGGCAAVICNTVGNAQRTYRLLKAWFPPEEVSLFHARFLYDDRARREQAALRRFGKPGASVVRPRRAVLVATQVIEQSLDLDFDLMVSDLAPVDLVLQRSGRLHRHRRDTRPPALREPTLWLLASEERNGLPVFTGGTTFVYDEHVLLRSWLALRDRRAIDVPEDVSALIESVYDDFRPCPITGPDGLAERWSATQDALQAERRRHESVARQVLIRPQDVSEDGFLEAWNRQLEEDDPRIHPELQALTRLGERSVTAVCLTPEEVMRLRPRAGDAWARADPMLRRSVGLTDRRIVHDLVRMEPPSSWKTTALLRYCRLIELDAAGEATIGRWRLRLDPELGAMVLEMGEE
jgi:CRISPR-associated endonuclease/helicase Cas3